MNLRKLVLENILKVFIRTVHDTLQASNTNAILLQTITPILNNQQLDTIIEKIEECIDITVLNGTSRSNFASKNARLYSVKVSLPCVLFFFLSAHMVLNAKNADRS